MCQYVNMPNFFSRIYLVESSPQLCEQARRRFSGLGWYNVHVICEDIQNFCLHDYENAHLDDHILTSSPTLGYVAMEQEPQGADLITLCDSALVVSRRANQLETGVADLPVSPKLV
jgi:betaine lipid synthase